VPFRPVLLILQLSLAHNGNRRFTVSGLPQVSPRIARHIVDMFDSPLGQLLSIMCVCNKARIADEPPQAVKNLNPRYCRRAFEFATNMTVCF
jgi:hypothetical protein